MKERFHSFSSFLRVAASPLESSAAHGPIWQLQLSRLGEALRKAMALDRRETDFPLPATRQIGTWSSRKIPVILTIQQAARDFRWVVAELSARLRGAFILLGPTDSHLDADCQELLVNVGAGFYALEGCVELASPGQFEASVKPDVLFERLGADHPERIEDATARQVFRLIKSFGENDRLKRPSVLTVFHLYCVEELSANQIASRQNCSKTAIIKRLNIIRDQTGMKPQLLRRMSACFQNLEAELADSRAREIRQRGLAYALEEEPEE